MEIKTYQIPVVEVQAVKFPVFAGFLTTDADALLESKALANEIMEWVKSNASEPVSSSVTVDESSGTMMLMTKQGWRFVNPGEWIIKHSDGSFGVCPDADFKSKYVEVTTE